MSPEPAADCSFIQLESVHRGDSPPSWGCHNKEGVCENKRRGRVLEGKGGREKPPVLSQLLPTANRQGPGELRFDMQPRPGRAEPP